MFFQALTRHQSVRNPRGFDPPFPGGSADTKSTIISLLCQVRLSQKLLALDCSELSGSHVKTQGL